MNKPHLEKSLRRILLLIACVALGSIVVWGQSPEASSEARETGIKFLQAGKYTDAVKALQKATKGNPLDADAWYYLGMACLQQQDFKQAVSAFEGAVKSGPNSARAYTGLSNALLRRSKLTESSKAAERALEIEPTNAEAHYILGEIGLRMGDKSRALDHAERAIAQNPKLAEAYLLKSQAAVAFSDDHIFAKNRDLRHNYFREAADSLEMYLQLNPGSESKKTWKDQLETLRSYLTPQTNQGTHVYVGKEVTTRVLITSKPGAGYTEEARKSLVEGTVVLKVVFGSDAALRRFFVVRALPYGLTDEAVKAAHQIRFIPATLNGKPVSMFVQLEYNFNLY